MKRSLQIDSTIRCDVALIGAGGAGALISRCIFSAETVAYPELGLEAIRRLKVKDLPVIVVKDVNGGDLHEEGVARYAC